MASGRPLVVSDVSALGPTVRAAGSGLVVPPGDSQALAEALDTLRAPALRAALAAAGRRHVETHFDLAACTRRLRRAPGRLARPTVRGRRCLRRHQDGPRRLCPQGLPAALRGVHHQRDLPRGASRRPASPLRHQGGRRGRPPRRRTPGADAARVPPAADLADQGAAAPLARQNRGLFLPAVVRTGRRHPVGLARAAGQALAQAVRARRRFLAAPRKLYVLELLRAVDLADRLDRAGDVARLHAHFAHGTTTVTWLASTITGLPFSFTGHAKDIYTEELNPAGLLRRKMDAASFVVTCTEANRRHLSSLGSRTPVHVALPRPERRLRASGRDGCATRHARAGPAAGGGTAGPQEGARHARGRVRAAPRSRPRLRGRDRRRERRERAGGPRPGGCRSGWRTGSRSWAR